jgi:hypothetical protein
MDLDRKLDEELAFSHEKTRETNATKSHQSHVIQCPSMSMKFHQLPIETHENPPSLLVKFTSLRPGHGALAFALGSPFCRCQSHGGYPQFSSIYSCRIFHGLTILASRMGMPHCKKKDTSTSQNMGIIFGSYEDPTCC